MQLSKPGNHNGWLLLLLVTIFAFTFLNFRGTDDIKTWSRWIAQMHESGLIGGYRSADSNYPPLTFVLLNIAVRAAPYLGLSEHAGIKVSLFLFLVATALVFLAYSRNTLLTVLVEMALVLSSVALIYLDIYFAPFLILALWALQRQKLALFTVCFAIACLIKWQPIVLAPFFALYVLKISRLRDIRAIPGRQFLTHVIGPAALVITLTLAIFGTPVLATLQQALTFPILSAQALNFNWILTYILNITDPSTYGHLANDVSPSFIGPHDGFVSMLPRPFFWLLFGVILVLWFRAAKTFENLLLYALLGYLAYFTFGVGAHENHLFIAVILSATLTHVAARYFTTFLIWALVANINLFVFYGIDGRTLPYSRVIWGFDTSILLAAVNVLLFIAFFVEVVRRGTVQEAPLSVQPPSA